MNPKQATRKIAYCDSICDTATDLLKARLPALIRQAVDCEFSTELPLALHASDAHFKLDSEMLQVTAEGIMDAVLERAALLVAQAIAGRVAAGDGEKWFAAKRRQEERAQREFDEYVRAQSEQAVRRARVSRLRQGPISSPKRSPTAEALRARIASLKLPRIQ